MSSTNEYILAHYVWESRIEMDGEKMGKGLRTIARVYLLNYIEL